MLYERAGNMAMRIAQALKQVSREATILLYAPALDRHLESMAELADRDEYLPTPRHYTPRFRTFGPNLFRLL
jgi:hypothetical protein